MFEKLKILADEDPKITMQLVKTNADSKHVLSLA
jgi:hypothetical protein